ncbi:uncharacterized protein LOC122794660 [Protopterus annectens]|uniref:uncharacterized protein LOC122794660 n=1 Tax=Protopterus annectens TaxID=7888 RepID=UPI001CFA68D3|nr:uncharacterized protein LOC122794660 [Protopterus annectens]
MNEFVIDIKHFGCNVTLRNIYGTNTEQVRTLRKPSTFAPVAHPAVELFMQLCNNADEKLRMDTHTKHYRNITLCNLQQNENAVIKPADKGGTIVVMDTSWYKKKMTTMLQDEKTYYRVAPIQFNRTIQKVSSLLQDMLTEGQVDLDLYNFFNITKPTVQNTNGLPKIHKDLHNSPLRPIAAGQGWPTETMSLLVEKELRTILKSCDTVLQDTDDFLRKKNQTMNNIMDYDHPLVTTLDVNSLFTSIPNEAGVEAVRKILSHKKTVNETSRICALLDLILENNYFVYGTSICWQKWGGGSHGHPLCKQLLKSCACRLGAGACIEFK